MKACVEWSGDEPALVVHDAGALVESPASGRGLVRAIRELLAR